MIYKKFRFNTEKNIQLQKERGIGFEAVIDLIESGNIVDTIDHHNSENYSNQCLYIIEVRDYFYYVPFVESDTDIFLKTIIPSRKIKKRYKNDNKI